MHGVGAELRGLQDFVGAQLTSIQDLGNIVYFRFGHELTIGVEGQWIVYDATGNVVASPPLNTTVVSAATSPPDAIELRFLSGHRLRIIDSSTEYESFSIPHADVYV